MAEEIPPERTCDKLSEEDWLHVYFTASCYFYTGRDCPGWDYGQKCGRIGRVIPQAGEVMAESADPYKDKRPFISRTPIVQVCPLTIEIGPVVIKATAVVDGNAVTVALDGDTRSHTLQALIENRVIKGLRITPIVQEAESAGGE